MDKSVGGVKLADYMDRFQVARGIVAPAPTMDRERALVLINQHTQVPLAWDRVYVLSLRVSTQGIDDYLTRMDISSLTSFEADFRAGLSLMNSHRTGGMQPAELPIGRIFWGEVVGQPLDRRVPVAEEAAGAAAVAYAYIVRGTRVNGIETDDLIAGCEAGINRDISVGFRRGDPRFRYVCSICNEDLFSEGCTHYPSRSYDGRLCYAWVEYAHAREASFVYEGATPQAEIIEAIRVAGGVPLTKSRQAKERTVKVDFFEQLLAGLRGVEAGLADQLSTATEEERAGLLIGHISTLRSLNADLGSRAKQGDKWVGSLIEQVIEQRTRALGAGGFDVEEVRSLLRAASPEAIQREIKVWSDVADRTIGNGERPSKTATKAAPSGDPRSYR